MKTVLKNVVQFTGLVVGVPESKPHGLNINNGALVAPQLGGASASGFTITADEVNVTVTRTADATSGEVNIYVEHWHTIEEVLGSNQLAGLVPFFFASGGGGGGGGGGSGTPNKVLKWLDATTPTDSRAIDDGVTFTVPVDTGLFQVSASNADPGTSASLNVSPISVDAGVSDPNGIGALAIQAGAATLYAGPASGVKTQVAVTGGPSGDGEIVIGFPGNPAQTIGAFGATPVVQPTVVGTTTDPVVQSLVAAFASLGWIIDGTT